MKDVVGGGSAVIGLSIALAILVPSSASFCQSELRHPVNLVLQEGQTVWKDPRGPLTQKAKELGLSPAEVQRIRKNTGYVICPGNVSGGESGGAAMLVGNGDFLVTDAHLFINPETNERREPLSDCMFVNQADPHDVVRLDFSSERSYKFYTKVPKLEWYNDRAVVRLKRRVPGARPFPIDTDEAPIRRGHRLIMISATQKQLTFPMTQYHFKTSIGGGKFTYELDLNEEPIAQACTAMGYYARTARASSVLYSDCSATIGASGSVAMIRKQDGSLAAKALLIQTGNPITDYKPFKIGANVPLTELSFTLSVGLDANVSDDIMAMERANE